MPKPVTVEEIGVLCDHKRHGMMMRETPRHETRGMRTMATETSERITAILYGEIAANSADDAEMRACQTRHKAVLNDRAREMARRDGAMEMAEKFCFAACERVPGPGHSETFQVMLAEAIENLHARYLRYCEEHPYPPEPVVDPETVKEL